MGNTPLISQINEANFGLHDRYPGQYERGSLFITIPENTVEQNEGDGPSVSNTVIDQGSGRSIGAAAALPSIKSKRYQDRGQSSITLSEYDQMKRRKLELDIKEAELRCENWELQNQKLRLEIEKLQRDL